MAQPTNRNEFREFCLKKLGKPVIEINVEGANLTKDDDGDPNSQVEQRIDEAVRYFQEYSADGHIERFLGYQVTAEDIERKYIYTTDIINAPGFDSSNQDESPIMGVTSVFPIGFYSSSAVNNLFSIVYHFFAQTIFQHGHAPEVTPYYMSRMGLSLTEEVLIGKQQIQYNKVENKIHLTFDTDRLSVGDFIILECYLRVNPDWGLMEMLSDGTKRETYPYKEVWKDIWLQNYATALLEQQWGMNLSKFSGMTMPGNIQFNGEQILERANAKITDLREQMFNQFSGIPMDFVG